MFASTDKSLTSPFENIGSEISSAESYELPDSENSLYNVMVKLSTMSQIGIYK